MENQIINQEDQYIRDLKFIPTINTSIPTLPPKKFTDIFWIRNNSGTMELYIYVGNSWKKVTLS